MDQSRRQFLACSAAAIAVPAIIPCHVLSAPNRPGANDRLAVGVIGVGNRAKLLIDQLPQQGQIVAAADCFLPRCHEAAAQRNAAWRIYHDYRALLDDEGVDAVIVGTHDHGRVLPCIRACQAGKDVYAEKPLTVYIAEGRALVNAVRKHGRVLQVGTQQRSMAINRIACEFVRSGRLGTIRAVLGMNYPGPNRYQGLPGQPIPDGLDWDAWIGATEMRPYHASLHYGWMGWRSYSGGQMTNWGAHGLDQIQWALGADDTGPVELWPITEGLNGSVGFRYANGVTVRLELEQGPMGGAVFAGENGKIEINRNKYTSNPPDLLTDLPPKEEIDKWRDEVALWQARYHLENWIDCIRTRELPVADVEIGHRSISLCHLANITRELGRRLRWNPETEQFVDDPEANCFVSRPRRAGYELPELG